MPDELDPDAVRAFAIFRHPCLAPRRDVPPRGDPVAISRMAVGLAGRVLGGVCDGDQCKVAECAGLLVYAMDGYGLNYEEVCSVAGHKVAEVLRQITPDNRQTDPRRHLELKSSLGQADAFVQAVKLAEILNVVERIPLEYDERQMAAKALDLKNWADRTGHLLEAMRALRSMQRMESAMDKARIGLGAIARLTEQAKAQRAQGRAKHVENGQVAAAAAFA
jgi:hypothetical protein